MANFTYTITFEDEDGHTSKMSGSLVRADLAAATASLEAIAEAADVLSGGSGHSGHGSGSSQSSQTSKRLGTSSVQILICCHCSGVLFSHTPLISRWSTNPIMIPAHCGESFKQKAPAE